MINDINSWQIADECQGVALGMVSPFSKRAACLIARNKTKPLLKSNFFNIQGAVEMMKGLDYHHDNFLNVVKRLAQIGLHDGADELKVILLHEAVAYLNRLGQFHYFIASPFVKQHCATAELLAPTIEKFVFFRHKHSAHRAIDAPRDESENIQTAQAMSMSSIGGEMFEPKPGESCNLLSVKTTADLDEYSRDQWKKCFLIFQLIIDDPNVFHNFSIEKEHPVIMREAFVVLEQVIK